MQRYKEVSNKPLRYRQIHLDFHTSEHCPSVGSDFDPDLFVDTLKKAYVNSITCFARCHHGWSYHETSVGKIHPNLTRELLPEMIEACHSRDINVPVYITVGWDELSASEHPEWCEKKPDGSPYGAGPLEAGWRKLCFNTPYLDYLIEYTCEVTRKYDIDGLFMDIIWQDHCVCPCCLASMEKEGLDPRNSDDAESFAKMVLENFYNRLNTAVNEIKPGLRIFHNRGNVDKGRQDLLKFFTHWELESLPTGGWGYDHFPVTARYASAAGIDFLGMTGKFHTSWGEFGGYKTPQALEYECCLMLAMGSKCSIGDQLHPSGKIDRDTYRIIGKAYMEVSKKEQWCYGTKPVSEVAIFSVESQHNLVFNYKNPSSKIDEGAARMLLEHQVMFDVIDCFSDFLTYRLIIFPDEVEPDDILKKKLKSFLDCGGMLLSSGTSGLDKKTNKFIMDIGAKYEGESEWEQDYIVADKLGGDDIPLSPMIMYEKSVNLLPIDCDVLAAIRPPYFNRNYRHFCSHRNTPYTLENSPNPAAVKKGNIIHFAHKVFSAYRCKGQTLLREIVMNAFDILCQNRQVLVNMPSGARMSFMRQEKEKRFILHLLYAVPMHRGEDIDVIEDIVPLYNIPCSIALGKKPVKVYLAPSGDVIDFEWKTGRAYFTVPEVKCHTMVVIE